MTAKPKDLPMLDGVSASMIYLEKMDAVVQPKRLFDFLCQKFAHIAVDEWRQRFVDGLVFWDDGVPACIDDEYDYGRTIYYYRFLKHEIIVPFSHEIIFENQELMVVDKPHFLTITPSGQYVQQTLLTRLKKDSGNSKLSPIHRLDKETAGLILISKNPATRGLYQSLFKSQNIKKIYHAIAPVRHDLMFPLDLHLHLVRKEPFYTMKVADGTPNSHTHITHLQTRGDWAKYELYPTTGKLHQLRVYLSHLGIPIKNDPYYPTVRHKAPDDFGSPLQLLAKSLSFIDPITGELMAFESKRQLEF